MSSSLHRITLGLIAAFMALALTTGYWAVVESQALTARDDNPRNVIAETRIRRGNILDRNEVVLAETQGEPGAYVRLYPEADAAHVTGYSSLRYGVSGIELAENAVLRGEAGQTPLEEFWQRDVLGLPQIGRDVRLTLDVELQRAAAAALRPGEVGAVVVLDALSGEVLAMVSAPYFDPNRLDADWEMLVADPRAPLLNRATFGSYQPGGALQPLLLAAALQRGFVAPEDGVVDPALQIPWRGGQLGCAQGKPAAGDVTVAEAFERACPSPFVDLGRRLGPAELTDLLADFGLFTAPSFSLPAVTTAFTPVTQNEADLRLAAAGLGELRVSPLQMALIAAGFANGGTLPPLNVVAATQGEAGDWIQHVPAGPAKTVLTAAAVAQVALLFPNQGGVAGHASNSLTGPQAEPLGWYLGFTVNGERHLAVAVALENSDAQRTEEVGIAALSADRAP